MRIIGENNEISVVNTSLGEEPTHSKFSSALHQYKRTKRILQDLLKKVKIKHDIAHINSSCRPIGIIRDWLCARILYKNSIPFIFHCHCNVEDQLGKGKIARFFFKKALCMSERVYVLNCTSEKFCSRFAPQKTKLCPNSIEERLIADAHQICESVKVVVYVGHLYASKGIEAIIATSKKYPDIQFNVVGKFNDRYNKRCNTNNLFFVGEKNETEVLKELDNADIFLFPSHSEGFSIALLEAMARGLPAIATNVGANREMLENKGGIVFDCISDDAIDLSRITDAKKRNEMSAWAIRKVKSKYTHAVVFKSIENDYKAIIRNRNI